MILVRCPACKHSMKTNPVRVSKSSKKCVYCGRSFAVRNSIIKPQPI